MSQKLLFEVVVAEVWHSTVRIRAENMEEAEKRAIEGQGEHTDDDFVYSHTLDEVVRVSEFLRKIET